AVFRRPMSLELLRGLAVYNAEQLETALRELIDRQIVIVVAEGGDRSYTFRHASIAELIRTHTAETKRRRMHGRIAAVLEQRGDKTDFQELATHLVEGRCGEKAVGYALRAAAKCKSEFAHEAALRFYLFVLAARALSFEQRCEAVSDAADVCFALGYGKKALRIIQST